MALDFNTTTNADGAIEFNTSIKAESVNLAENRGNVEDALNQACVPESTISQIILAIDESLANVMEHAVEEDQPEDFLIRLSLLASADRVKITIKDPGQNFNPMNIKNPDMQEHIAAGKKGGLGIFIIRKIMDVFEHNYSDGCNVITLEKKLN